MARAPEHEHALDSIYVDDPFVLVEPNPGGAGGHELRLPGTELEQGETSVGKETRKIVDEAGNHDGAAGTAGKRKARLMIAHLDGKALEILVRNVRQIRDHQVEAGTQVMREVANRDSDTRAETTRVPPGDGGGRT